MSIAETGSTTNVPASQSSAPAKESLLQKIEHTFSGDETKVITVMEAIGRDCLKGLTLVQTYLPAAETLAGTIFPAQTASIAGAVNVIDLIEKSVATVEAKWTAGNESSKNGLQKLADVLSLAESAVIGLLTPLGVHADTSYVTKLISVVVSILNIRTTTASSVAA